MAIRIEGEGIGERSPEKAGSMMEIGATEPGAGIPTPI